MKPRKKYPYYSRYPSDFFGSQKVRLMPPEARAYYSLLLDVIWDYDTQYSIPDKPEIIAPLLGISEDHWLTLRERYVDGPKGGCLYLNKGRLISPRLLKERRKIDKFSKNQSLRGKKGAKKRWGKV